VRKLFGYVILTQDELDLRDRQAAQEKETIKVSLSVQTELARKALAEIEFYQKKYEEALDRADRQLDTFMNSVGMPEVTTTGRRETITREKKAEEQWEKKEKELMELYSETVNTTFDESGLELSDDLKQASEQLLAEHRAESDSAKIA
jgi:hypothetical protein